jgi:serine/threonine protein kinase
MRAVEHIHSQSYAHRDLTLKNILIAYNGRGINFSDYEIYSTF